MKLTGKRLQEYQMLVIEDWKASDTDTRRGYLKWILAGDTHRRIVRPGPPTARRAPGRRQYPVRAGSESASFETTAANCGPLGVKRETDMSASLDAPLRKQIERRRQQT